MYLEFEDILDCIEFLLVSERVYVSVVPEIR